MEETGVEFIQFLNDHFAWVFLLLFASAAASVGGTAYRRRRQEKQNPPPPESASLFEEKRVSGFSRKNLFTRFGGANNALVVRITKELLIIEPLPMFKWVMAMGFNDLEHRILRSKIVKVERTRGLLYEGAAIEFFLDDGTTREIELRLANVDQFLLVLEGFR